ncbi:MAG: PorT family protein [Mediterranea sp.]|jgi:hypothetical protein|nr:PorT family protein [Mediterranea sp.]
MFQENEEWVKQVKQQLKDYSEPLPAGGWDKLEEALAARETPVATLPKKNIFTRRLRAAAAIVVLALLSGTVLWLTHGNRELSVIPSATPTLATAPDAESIPSLPHTATPQPQAPVRRQAGQGSYNQLAVLTSADTSPFIEENKAATPLPEETVQAEETTTPTEEAQTTPKVEPKPRPYRPASKDELPLRDAQPVNQQKGRWSVGLSVGNSGGVSSNQQGYMVMQSDGLFSNGEFDLSSVSETPVGIQDGDNIAFNNGLPYLKSSNRIQSIRHRQPISVGVNVRKELPKGFSVEAGVTYTQLVSDVVLMGSNDNTTQRLHYIGIPVRANWNIISRKLFTAYLSAGGTVEKCVYGKLGSEEISVNPLQFSVAAAVGAQYNLSRKVGIYVEPGISHYFDDHSGVQTIRTENDLNFTLQAGLRLTY